MTERSTAKLGELCNVLAGGTPSRSNPSFWNAGIPWVKISDMLQGRIRYTEETISKEGLEKSTARLLPKGTLLLSIFATIGRTAVLDIEAATNQAIVGLIPKRTYTIEINYLRRYLETQVSILARKGRGGAQSNINSSILKDLDIPLLSLDEQRRIAVILDKADTLRRQRQESFPVTEKLLHSVFVEMFGDPVRNTKHLPTEELHNLARLERGKFTPRPRNDPSYYGGQYPFIQTGDISRSNGRITAWTQTLNDKGVAVSKQFEKGTVVIAIVGATLGETAIVETPVYCPDSIIGITPHNDKATPEFIEFLLRLWKPRLKQLAPDAARANLNLERLRPLMALAPPIQEQQEFSRRATMLRALVLANQESEVQLNRLFSSLQQRAFGGDLDLSSLNLDVAELPAPPDEPEKPLVKVSKEAPARLIFHVPETLQGVLLKLDTTVQKGGSIPWSADYFKYRILGAHRAPFSFSELMQKTESVFDDPPYEEIKDVIFDLLGKNGGPAILCQSFDLHVDENTKESSGRKEILFGPAA